MDAHFDITVGARSHTYPSYRAATLAAKRIRAAGFKPVLKPTAQPTTEQPPTQSTMPHGVDLDDNSCIHCGEDRGRNKRFCSKDCQTAHAS